jgi:pimeloyl-ACP methyl ester carboxylesterase
VVLAVAAAAAALSGASPAIALKPCTLPRFVPARCGRLAVREDRRVRDGRKIQLFVAVVRAFGPRPHGPPIFWLSGGPGGAAATDDASFATSSLRTANVKHDIVLVDQRGVGKSAPLVCPKPTGEEGLESARACLAGVRRDPRLYTTDAAMDDVDAVRNALRYKRVLLYGGSYGATAAQVYIARHGTRVAAAILDGGTLLDVPIWARMPRSTQDAFDRLAARCAADAVCRAAFPDVSADLQTAFDALRAKPLDNLGVADAQGLVRYLLRAPETAARVPLILHRAASGNYRELLDLSAELQPAGIETGRKLMYWAIRCGEGWSRLDATEAAQFGAGTQFLETTLAEAETMDFACSLIGPPVPAPDTGVVPKSNVPVLFLVGGMDPQDPLENVATARDSLAKADILVVPGAGHGSLQHGCIPLVAARFFMSYRLTTADRRCAASIVPPPFVTR